MRIDSTPQALASFKKIAADPIFNVKHRPVTPSTWRVAPTRLQPWRPSCFARRSRPMSWDTPCVASFAVIDGREPGTAQPRRYRA